MADFATPVSPTGEITPASVTITAAGGVPVVAARLTGRPRSSTLDEQGMSVGTSGPSTEWLLPAATVSPRLADEVLLVDPGSRAATVSLFELAQGPTRLQLGVVTLLPGSEVAVDLGRIVHGQASFAVEVSATAPVLAEQQFTPLRGLTTAVGGLPVVG